MRRGLGPVFAYEWLLTARRWQFYAGRSLFVAVLLVSLAVAWLSGRRSLSGLMIQDLAEVGELFFYAIIGTQLVLVLLVAPAATAGALCLDKTRGTLLHLLATDLSDVEIVLGKLVARAIPALGLVACAVPVMALGSLLGGIDPMALLGATLVSLGLALLGSSMALALSVWARKTHEVLLATYLVWGVWLLILPIAGEVSGWYGLGPPRWVEVIDPFWIAFAPYAEPGAVGPVHDAAYFGACLVTSAVLIAVAVLRTRAVTIRQADGVRPRRGPSRLAIALRRQVRAWPGPSLDANPVLWREWHRGHPSLWGRAVAWAYIGLASAATAIAIVQSLTWGNGTELAPWVNGIQASVGLVFAAVLAPLAIAEERVSGSLDVLLATPLPTCTIVWGKWWGAFRVVPSVAVLPGLLAHALTWQNYGRWAGPFLIVGLILAYGAALASLGLALATWIGRVGRTLALSVAAHVLATVGWFYLALTLFDNNGLFRPMAEASPFFGVGMLTAAIEMNMQPDRDWNRFTSWALIWILFYAAVALILLLATLATFDRCLGRVAQRPLAAGRRPAARP